MKTKKGIQLELGGSQLNSHFLRTDTIFAMKLVAKYKAQKGIIRAITRGSLEVFLGRASPPSSSADFRDALQWRLAPWTENPMCALERVARIMGFLILGYWHFKSATPNLFVQEKQRSIKT